VALIGVQAFRDIPTLKEIKFGKSLFEIQERAFENTGLISLVIPDSVKILGNASFAWNQQLTSVVIGNSIDKLPPATFQESSFSSITIPYSVKYIGDSLFFGNMNIQNIAILNPQVVIDKKAFILYNQSILKIEYCGDLSEVPIPSSTDAGLKISPICTAELQKLTSNSKAAEADAKFAAEKTSAELKAKQEADAKAAAELKAKQEADAKAAAELKTKQEAEAKAAADKATGEKIISDAKSEAARILAAAKAAAAKKKITITCFKGKLTKKVTAVKPVCPKGYKKK
jgi:hypothetical protein